MQRFQQQSCTSLCVAQTLLTAVHSSPIYTLHLTFVTLLYICAGRAGYVRDPETQMADKAASGTELTKVTER
jgi:hypothetical protein